VRQITPLAAPVVPEQKPTEIAVAGAAPENEQRRGNETGKTRHKAGTWTACIRDIVAPTLRPWPYSEVKAALVNTHVGPLLERSDKAFYGAIEKLERDEIIKRYKGHLFSPEGYRNFMAALKEQRVRDLKFPNLAHRSILGDAVASMMKGKTDGAESGRIIFELCRDPELAEAISKNKTHIYNVLNRLVAQDVLRKVGKRYYYHAIKNEALPGLKSGSASISSAESSDSAADSREAPHGLFG
jgi:hypothetical protein